jgi:hypothetical protein
MSSPLREVLGTWLVLAVVGVATLVTYSRIPPEETYHVSHSELAGGLSRALVYLNFPVALLAIAILPFAAIRLARVRPRLATTLAVPALLLCMVAVVPGVVRQSNLDARPINVLPAAGVALVALLTVLALVYQRDGEGLERGSRKGDWIRIVMAAGLLVMAIPWAFAEAGFFAPAPFLSRDVPAGETLPAVHLGRHHGIDGVMLALAALALSRALGSLRYKGLSLIMAGYLALMLSYGIANAVQDAWGEQVVKRGWTDWTFPSVLVPEPSLAWASLLVVAAVVFRLWFFPASAPPALSLERTTS